MGGSEEIGVGLFMVVVAVGMAGMWTIDIVRSPEVDRGRGLLRARDRSTGSLLFPHWLAEYGTAALLLGSGIGLLLRLDDGSWAWLIPLALGALAYTSINSLGWVFADRSRFGYGAPIMVALAGALCAIALLLGGRLPIAPAG